MSTIAQSFSRLVRFIPKSSPSRVMIGEPLDSKIDVGMALFEGEEVSVQVFSGNSVLKPGVKTGSTEIIARVLSPISQNEAGSIRCIGLNYISHAKEMNLSIPEVPVLFLKPSTSLADPWPSPTILPKITQNDDTGDYEAELVIVIGQDAKDVSEKDAMNYVLGYTAANDVSSRASQTNQTQWCFSKGIDTSCPIGPTLVSPSYFTDATRFHIRGIKNGKVMQDCPLTDLIFSVPKIVSFLSQGTTLPAGTLILTGTPPGVGAARNPRETLRAGDTFAVELLPHVGTLITKFENQA